jgi:Uma2 family endonuclease
VVFISSERYASQPDPSGFLEVAPELLVEILSPSDRVTELMQRLRECFAIGVQLVWVADPGARTVYVYRSLTEVREFRESDQIIGDGVLPGFEVPVATLFED